MIANDLLDEARFYESLALMHLLRMPGRGSDDSFERGLREGNAMAFRLAARRLRQRAAYVADERDMREWCAGIVARPVVA